MITHLATVGICVRDQQKALEFYTQKLGFTLQRDTPMGPPGPDTPRWIQVVPKKDFSQTALVLFTPTGLESRIGTFTSVVLSCTNVDEVYQDLSSRGVEFTELPNVQPWGKNASFKDPDGNVFVLKEESA